MVPGLNLELVRIEPGTFLMGTPDKEARGNADERQTQVTISRPYWIGKYEVTQAQYLALMGKNPSSFKGDTNRPVESITWFEATNFCGRLTARERQAERLPAGYVYRLPTEAEWEYACRAGTTNRFSFGDDPNYKSLGNYAWYWENSYSTTRPTGGFWDATNAVIAGRYYATHPVGQKLPNPWGLYDMYGNVSEWCLDWYGLQLPGGHVTDPQGPSIAPLRVCRGGGWEEEGARCRSTSRDGGNPSISLGSRGFRVVLAQPLGR